MVGIEQASMTAVFCANTADRTAATWEKPLAPFDRLEFAVSDDAKGIAKAVAKIAAARRDDPRAPTLDHGLDVFHTAMEARRVLARHWRRAEVAWEEAEEADIEVDRARQQGVDAWGPAGPARTAWREATATLGQVEHREGAWRRAQAALEIFRPDGRLNDRATAEAEITAALPGLPSADWAKVRNFLRDRPSLAFLRPDAPPPGIGRAAAPVGRGDGLALVAPAPSSRGVGPVDRAGPCGGSRSPADRAGAGVV